MKRNTYKQDFLKPEDFESAKAIQDPEEKVFITTTTGAHLKKILAKQQDFSNEDLKTVLSENATAHIGLFIKPDRTLIGMNGLYVMDTVNYGQKSVSPSLETTLRLVASHRGQGYGTEFKTGLIKYLTDNALIPTHQSGLSENTPYWGLSGLVDFENRASLKASIKCGYGIFELLGPEVHVYYPRNMNAEENRSDSLDLVSAFDNYLSKDEEISLSGKKALLFYSLQRFVNERAPLNIDESIELQTYCGHCGKSSSSLSFIVNTIHDFPDVFERLSEKEKSYFSQKFITPDAKEMLETFIGTGRADQYIPKDETKKMETALNNLNDLLASKQ